MEVFKVVRTRVHTSSEMNGLSAAYEISALAALLLNAGTEKRGELAIHKLFLELRKTPIFD
jgi:hypothetical protein